MPYKIVFNCKSWTPILIVTAFLQCFWIFTQIGFSLFWTLVSSFGEVYDAFGTVFLGASFIYFSKFSNFGAWFSDFSDYWPKKIVFLAWGRFCMFLRSIILPMCLQFFKFSINLVWSVIKVDRIYVPVNMALAIFHKQL